MSYIKVTINIALFLLLFVGVCAFSLDHFLSGSGYDPSSAINQTILGEQLQAIFIVMFWFVVFMVPDWNFL